MSWIVRKVSLNRGHFTFDPGFQSKLRSCESQFTFITGDEGVLLHLAIRSASSTEKSTRGGFFPGSSATSS